jgi:hypothetical protein
MAMAVTRPHGAASATLMINTVDMGVGMGMGGMMVMVM